MFNYFDTSEQLANHYVKWASLVSEKLQKLSHITQVWGEGTLDTV